MQGQTSTWIHGLKFLWQKENTWPRQVSYYICDEDPEVKHSLKTNLSSSRTTTLDRLERISSWLKMKRVVAIMFRFKDMLLDIIKSDKINTTEQLVDMNLLQRSESSIIKMYQQRCFPNEISRLVDGNCVSRKSNIFKLDPFLDDHEIIRVGGRISQSRMEYKLKHPILLPKNGHVTSVIIDFSHRRVGHGSRGMTINEIKSNGFWVINCTAAMKSKISKCDDFRKLHGKSCQQKMSDLPEQRLIEEPPFSYCGVDMSGPFLVKEGQKIHKRYGAMFTCLCSRAVYKEATNSMTTDSFIQVIWEECGNGRLDLQEASLLLY